MSFDELSFDLGSFDTPAAPADQPQPSQPAPAPAALYVYRPKGTYELSSEKGAAGRPRFSIARLRAKLGLG